MKISKKYREALHDALEDNGCCDDWHEALNHSYDLSDFIGNLLKKATESIDMDGKLEDEIEELTNTNQKIKEQLEENEFGTLNELMKEAGVKLNPNWHFDRQKIVAALSKTSELNVLEL